MRIWLDHIGIASEDLSDALARWTRLIPAAPSAIEEVPGEHVRLSFLDVGSARLELLESTSDDSAIGRFLRRRGPGIHHLSFRVAGTPIDDWFRELERRGVPLVGAGPREGSGADRVFFVHPRATAGVLVEFAQAPEEVRA